MEADSILEVRGLTKHFPIRRGVMRRVVGYVKAVDGVDFSLRRGKTLGIVGESGSGKTTTGRMLLRALDPTAGTIHFRRDNGKIVDIAKLPRSALREIWTEIQMVFQDPYGSLNPRLPVLDIIAEPLRAHGWSAGAREKRVRELMERVGLDPRYMRRYPHAFSGGQRQRIGIARSLALNPKLVVADEPVSALDVSVQAQILNLLENLRDEMNLTLIFIAHDLSVVRYLCDEVAVMYHGRLVEQAQTEALFHSPRHPYTAALLRAAPAPDPSIPWDPEGAERDPVEAGTVAKVSHGCPFAPRCPHVIDDCWKTVPPLEPADEESESPRLSACIRQKDLTLTGV